MRTNLQSSRLDSTIYFSLSGRYNSNSHIKELRTCSLQPNFVFVASAEDVGSAIVQKY